MNQLKQVKNKLRQENIWASYKETFKHKQMKLITTKIALIFKDKININVFYKLEKELMSKTKNKEMFKEAFAILEKEVKYKANWEELGKFMWYAFQTSTFYKDQKKDIKNIYTYENSIRLNTKKREHFLKWLHSVDKKDIEFNNKIIAVQKLVL